MSQIERLGDNQSDCGSNFLKRGIQIIGFLKRGVQILVCGFLVCEFLVYRKKAKCEFVLPSHMYISHVEGGLST